MATRAKILGIYGLLIATGIYISTQIFFSGRNIQHTTSDLLSSNVPLISDITTIKLSMVELERGLYEYYATNNQDEMLAQRDSTVPTLKKAMNNIAETAPNDARLARITNNVSKLLALSGRLEAVLTANRVDWDLARAILVEITAENRSALPSLNAMKKDFQSALLSTSDLVNQSTNTTTQLVWAFCTLAVLLAGLVAFYLERFIRLAAARSYLAYFDPLTKLPNRQKFESETKSSNPANELSILGLIKLDRFNLVTAGHGLAVGDAVIEATAKRIQSLLPEGGRCFRFGGATFAITLSQEPKETWFKQFIQAFEQPLKAQKAEFYLSISLGYCVIPDDGEDYDSLIKNADACLSRVTSKGGNAYRRYTPDLFAQEQTWFILENELRDAISDNQLELHYQPQIDTKTMSLVGMEALLRWNSPTRGNVSPGTFIPLAEQTGLIVKIGDWVLRQACQQALSWYRQYSQDCVVAVNISPKQFMHPDFVQSVALALQESKVMPHLIELEITEGVMIENTEQCLEILNQLKNLGIQLSIDDFGTGYSSLVYLKRFRIDKLKVDQAFIRNLDNDKKDEAIVRTIIDMAHNLNLKVIAEGVETVEQQKKLQSFNCDELQGYLISKPKPPRDLCEFFASFPSKTATH